MRRCWCIQRRPAPRRRGCRRRGVEFGSREFLLSSWGHQACRPPSTRPGHQLMEGSLTRRRLQGTHAILGCRRVADGRLGRPCGRRSERPVPRPWIGWMPRLVPAAERLVTERAPAGARPRSVWLRERGAAMLASMVRQLPRRIPLAESIATSAGRHRRRHVGDRPFAGNQAAHEGLLAVPRHDSRPLQDAATRSTATCSSPLTELIQSSPLAVERSVYEWWAAPTARTTSTTMELRFNP